MSIRDHFQTTVCGEKTVAIYVTIWEKIATSFRWWYSLLQRTSLVVSQVGILTLGHSFTARTLWKTIKIDIMRGIWHETPRSPPLFSQQIIAGTWDSTSCIRAIHKVEREVSAYPSFSIIAGFLQSDVLHRTCLMVCNLFSVIIVGLNRSAQHFTAPRIIQRQ